MVFSEVFDKVGNIFKAKNKVEEAKDKIKDKVEEIFQSKNPAKEEIAHHIHLKRARGMSFKQIFRTLYALNYPEKLILNSLRLYNEHYNDYAFTVIDAQLLSRGIETKQRKVKVRRLRIDNFKSTVLSGLTNIILPLVILLLVGFAVFVAFSADVNLGQVLYYFIPSIVALIFVELLVRVLPGKARAISLVIPFAICAGLYFIIDMLYPVEHTMFVLGLNMGTSFVLSILLFVKQDLLMYSEDLKKKQAKERKLSFKMAGEEFVDALADRKSGESIGSLIKDTAGGIRDRRHGID